jgi:hypothetical protein
MNFDAAVARRHEEARRLKIRRAGLLNRFEAQASLEQAQHDGAYEGESDVGGQYAQSADQGTEGHSILSGLTSAHPD